MTSIIVTINISIRTLDTVDYEREAVGSFLESLTPREETRTTSSHLAKIKPGLGFRV